ncbi:MAG: dihydrofolate reductase [Candidatus Omnitrophica bacterium]|nr:dihydrofolate reductase [Candidatus Omnitrophota bacterium]
MKLYHVVAMAKNRVIGKDNKLPWHFSSDLKHFKQLTTGSTVIMGRKTFESIGKPLAGRENIVLSRNSGIALSALPPRNDNDAVIASERSERSNLIFCTSLEEALKKVRTFQAYIIGGGKIYQQTMDKVDGIYLTVIDQDFEGDAFYPEIPAYFKEKSKTFLQENPKIEVLFYANTKKI